MTQDDLAMAMANEVTRKVADGKKVSVNASAGYLWKTDLLIIRKKKKYFFHPKKKKDRPAHASDMSLRIVIVDVRKEAMTHFAARGHLVARYGGSRPVVSVRP